MAQHIRSSRLNEIYFVFPNRTKVEQAWNQAFGKLLSELSGHDRLTFQPSPRSSLPFTTFRSTGADFPGIILNSTQPVQVQFGSITIRNEPAFNGAALLSPLEANAEMADIPVENERALPVTALYSRLKGHLVSMDHTGVNIPVTMLEQTEWDSLMDSLSQVSNMYRYPGEAWPFILPATEEEFQLDITDFTAVRTPKFEWVYDRYSPRPLFQFALVTDLTRLELEEAFPGPSGFAIPGLDFIFRSVQLDSPWHQHLDIRIDLYYKRSEGGPTDWETGEWLVTEGGRIRS